MYSVTSDGEQDGSREQDGAVCGKRHTTVEVGPLFNGICIRISTL